MTAEIYLTSFMNVLCRGYQRLCDFVEKSEKQIERLHLKREENDETIKRRAF
jgi:hypothetical protein